MTDNNKDLNEDNSFYLDPNIQIKHSYSYTHYLFYNRSIDTQNNPINRKYIGQFILGERLGQGTFGVVVLGTHQITGEKVAVKILDKEKILQETDKFRLEREIKILKNMRHNNIVHLYDVKETPTSLYIIMEYICGKELFEYIIYNKRLSELEACKFYQQIISGIEYLGKIKVVHRDIKPENLLLDNKNNIKIVDFGLSNSYPKNELLTTACGSPCYAAPEMINGERYYGLKADIWSSGIVLYAMLCGYLPFEESDNEKLYKKITEGKFKTPNFLSDSAKDLLHRILNVDPKSRITIKEMKKHPWFNLVNPKLNMTEGLLLNKVIVPIDENIIYKMVNEYKFNGEEVRTNLLLNNHNHITTTYFLILNQKLRNGEKTIGNMKSKEFIKYIHSPTNFLSHYGNNIKKIIQLRAKLIDNKSEFEEKDIKNKRNKNSVNGFSAGTQSGSTGIMNVGSSIEKLSKKEKRESSVTQRRNYKLLGDEKTKNKKEQKTIPKSVDTKIKKIKQQKNKNNEKNKISATPDIKGKQEKNNNIRNLIINRINLKGYEMEKNKRRNTEIKNKKNLITELKSEEKESKTNKNYILEEIEETKGPNNIDNVHNKEKKHQENNSSKPKKIYKLNKKAITNKNVRSNKKRFDTLIDKKDIDKKKKLKRLVEKKNITERKIQIKSYNINKEVELNNDTEKENDEIIMNTDINKYVKLSKLMRRMKENKKKEKKNSSKRNKSSLDEDSSLKAKKFNITEREEIMIKSKDIQKENIPITDRYENVNENKTYIYKKQKKRNIITNIYNYKYQKNNDNIIKNKRAEKILKKINKKFIDTSISFDKTKDEIDKNNKDNILISNEANHIEENDDSDKESSEENNNNSNNNIDNFNNKENTNIKEEEELKKKEKDIKYLKLKSKHKKFNIVIKNDVDKVNNTIKQHTYKNTKDNINNNIFIRSFKKTKTKNINNSKNDKIKLLNTHNNSDEKNNSINHHTTINNYQTYLNYSKKSDNKNKYSNGSLNKKNRYKNNESNFYDDVNNDMTIFDLNSIYYFKNYSDIKEIKEKIKKDLDNKKVKYNLKKNKFFCYYKNENKFEIEICPLYPIYEVKNSYIIKYIKKLGNTSLIKDLNKSILFKLNA